MDVASAHPDRPVFARNETTAPASRPPHPYVRQINSCTRRSRPFCICKATSFHLLDPKLSWIYGYDTTHIGESRWLLTRALQPAGTSFPDASAVREFLGRRFPELVEIDEPTPGSAKRSRASSGRPIRSRTGTSLPTSTVVAAVSVQDRECCGDTAGADEIATYGSSPSQNAELLKAWRSACGTRSRRNQESNQ